MSIAADHISDWRRYRHAMDDAGRVLARAEELAQEFLAGLGTRPVWPRATFEQMLEAFDGPLPESGADPVAVLDELATTADPGLAGTAGPRFFGFVIGGHLPAALGADVLTSTWDQNAGINSLTPAAAAIEVVAGRWVVDALGLPAGAAVGLVTGGMMANYTCLSAGRHAVLARAGWDVAARGLFEAPRVRVVVGRFRHDTIDRAVRYLGLGQDVGRRGGHRRPGPDRRRRPGPGARRRRGSGDRLPPGGRGALRGVRRLRRRDPGRPRRTTRGCTSTARSACGPRPARRTGT